MRWKEKRALSRWLEATAELTRLTADEAMADEDFERTIGIILSAMSTFMISQAGHAHTPEQLMWFAMFASKIMERVKPAILALEDCGNKDCEHCQGKGGHATVPATS